MWGVLSEVGGSLCLNNRCSVGCSVGSPIAISISTVLQCNLNSNAHLNSIPHFEHFEMAFLAFALSCLMLSIGFVAFALSCLMLSIGFFC